MPRYKTGENLRFSVSVPSALLVGVITPETDLTKLTYILANDSTSAIVAVGLLSAPAAGMTVVQTATFQLIISVIVAPSLHGNVAGKWSLAVSAGAGSAIVNISKPEFTNADLGGAFDDIATGAADATTVKTLTAAGQAGDLAAVKIAVGTTLPARLVSTGATLKADVAAIKTVADNVYGDTHSIIPATLGNPAAPGTTPGTIAGNIGSPVGASLADDIAAAVARSTQVTAQQTRVMLNNGASYLSLDAPDINFAPIIDPASGLPSLVMPTCTVIPQAGSPQTVTMSFMGGVIWSNTDPLTNVANGNYYVLFTQVIGGVTYTAVGVFQWGVGVGVSASIDANTAALKSNDAKNAAEAGLRFQRGNNMFDPSTGILYVYDESGLVTLLESWQCWQDLAMTTKSTNQGNILVTVKI